MDDGGDQDLEDAWTQVTRHWEDPGAHDAFLQACFAKSKLGFAAVRYQAVVDGSERQREIVAQKRLAGITALALHGLETTRTEPPRRTPRWLFLVVSVLVSLSVAWMIYAFTR